jgi:dipeptidyl aminopeptidase/acylaminoacyl peptidase
VAYADEHIGTKHAGEQPRLLVSPASAAGEAHGVGRLRSPYSWPSISPNGRLAAYSKYRARGGEKIVVRNLRSSHDERFDPGRLGMVRGVTWSADGSLLVYDYETVKDHKYSDQLMLLRVDQKRGRVASSPLPVPRATGLRDPRISPDGKWIAGVTVVHGSQQARRSTLALYNVARGRITRTLYTDRKPSGTNTPELMDPAWSPDGHRLAVVNLTNQATAHQQVETTRILVFALHRGGSTPRVAATGHRLYLLIRPGWRTRHELWFSRHSSSNGDDSAPPSTPADLYVVRVGHGRPSAPKKMTNTPNRDEEGLSFGRPNKSRT